MEAGGERRSPSEELAAKIATALQDAGLIDAEQRARVEERLASGALGEAEWQALIEAGLSRTAGEAGNVAGD